MTESEWLVSNNPATMLRWVTNPSDNTNPLHLYSPSDRKLRLFACAMLRRFAAFMGPNAAARIPRAEAYADGTGPEPRHWPAVLSSGGAAVILDPITTLGLWEGVTMRPHGAEAAALLRDIVGNPWRPVKLPPYTTGLHDHVWDIASCAYDEPLPDGALDGTRLAVLSDALEEAGCEAERKEQCPACDGMGGYNEAGPNIFWQTCRRCDGAGFVPTPHPLLVHLRSPGPHVRGCWALDLILGKE